MNTYIISCPICGHRYEPSEHGACGACPLNPNCEMVCCPACGHTTIDYNQSRLVQLASSFLKFRKDNGRRKLKDDQLSLREPRRRASQTPIHPESSGRHRSLVEVLAGRRVRLCGFGKEMSDKHREHLKAYGMVPGFWIDVIQQSPVTVLKIEHTELVLEHNLAINIQVVDEN